MDTYQELFEQCKPYQLNPHYAGEEVHEIRGIALPMDYMEFLRLHNGGTFSNPNNEDDNRMVLFSLEEIQKGECYKDEDGYLLGSAYSQTHEYQNIDTQTVTTSNGIPCEDSDALYQAFYDEHIVIGFYEEGSRSATSYTDIIAIDREGYYRVICDGYVEELGRHEFGTHVKTDVGGYVKYHTCLYESPMGLLDPSGVHDGKAYRIVDRSELEIRKKKYEYYRFIRQEDGPHWEYQYWITDQDEYDEWKGSSVKNLFTFFLSGRM